MEECGERAWSLIPEAERRVCGPNKAAMTPTRPKLRLPLAVIAGTDDDVVLIIRSMRPSKGSFEDSRIANKSALLQ